MKRVLSEITNLQSDNSKKTPLREASSRKKLPDSMADQDWKPKSRKSSGSKISVSRVSVKFNVTPQRERSSSRKSFGEAAANLKTPE